jgi:hypothetical protein
VGHKLACACGPVPYSPQLRPHGATAWARLVVQLDIAISLLNRWHWLVIDIAVILLCHQRNARNSGSAAEEASCFPLQSSLAFPLPVGPPGASRSGRGPRCVRYHALILASMSAQEFSASFVRKGRLR